MPSHSLGVPKLADRIAEALYTRFANGAIDRLDAVFSQWQPGHGVHVERRRLFPLDMSGFSRPTNASTPILNLAPELLLIELTADYVHAQLCKTALHAFAAENEARMEAMASAHRQIDTPPFRVTGQPTNRTAGRNHCGNHRTCRGRDGKPIRVHAGERTEERMTFAPKHI